MNRFDFTARCALCEMANGRLSSEELLSECLRQVDDREGEVGAWAYLDRTQIIEQLCDPKPLRLPGKAAWILSVGLVQLSQKSSYPDLRRGCFVSQDDNAL